MLILKSKVVGTHLFYNQMHAISPIFGVQLTLEGTQQVLPLALWLCSVPLHAVREKTQIAAEQTQDVYKLNGDV